MSFLKTLAGRWLYCWVLCAYFGIATGMAIAYGVTQDAVGVALFSPMALLLGFIALREARKAWRAPHAP